MDLEEEEEEDLGGPGFSPASQPDSQLRAPGPSPGAVSQEDPPPPTSAQLHLIAASVVLGNATAAAAATDLPAGTWDTPTGTTPETRPAPGRTLDTMMGSGGAVWGWLGAKGSGFEPPNLCSLPPCARCLTPTSS